MKIILILGDQLSQNISSLKNIDKEKDVILICELYNEAEYVKHHKKKIAFLFSAMRHFAEELRGQGYNIDYLKLGDDHTKSFETALKWCVQKHNPDKVIVTEAGEYRLKQNMQSWESLLDCSVEIREDDRFLCSHAMFQYWAGEKKQLRMEFFYREMRKKYNILMDLDQPIGGKWNYDSENRKPPKSGLDIPKPYQGNIDAITREVLDLVADKFPDHFGDLDPFYFAVTHAQALDVLDKFIAERLSHFGDYQDAMIQNEPWMYHSHISFYMNCGLLDPMEAIQKVEQAYHDGHAPLNAAEGFIRQILGWREYVRGIYWLKMPDYKALNFFEATRKLPELYWNGQTKMNCMRQAVLETKENAYAHHIQRLMLLGNFALIAGIAPEEINEWFLIVYADAYEWVELPNVSGMILFADGGYLGSKPYAAGGSYINKMSNYCKGCSYKVTKKNGLDACPFNYLYWDFLARNREKLQGNHRMGMMYRTYDRMDDDKKQAITTDSQRFLKGL